jgi:hypothetical protein
MGTMGTAAGYRTPDDAEALAIIARAVSGLPGQLALAWGRLDRPRRRYGPRTQPDGPGRPVVGDRCPAMFTGGIEE